MPEEARWAGAAIAWCPSSAECAMGRGRGLQPPHQAPGLLHVGLAVPCENNSCEGEASASPALGDPGPGAQGRALAGHSGEGSEEHWWRAGPVGHVDMCPEWVFSRRKAELEGLERCCCANGLLPGMAAGTYPASTLTTLEGRSSRRKPLSKQDGDTFCSWCPPEVDRL